MHFYKRHRIHDERFCDNAFLKLDWRCGSETKCEEPERSEIIQQKTTTRKLLTKIE